MPNNEPLKPALPQVPTNTPTPDDIDQQRLDDDGCGSRPKDDETATSYG